MRRAIEGEGRGRRGREKSDREQIRERRYRNKFNLSRVIGDEYPSVEPSEMALALQISEIDIN